MDKDHLSGLSWPFFAIFGLLFLGAATAFYRYLTEPGAELMLIVGLWTTFNLVIAGVALGVVAERRETDRFPRLPIERQGILGIGNISVPVYVTSVSAGGCAIRFAKEDQVPVGLETGARCTLAVVPLDGTKNGAPLMIDLVHATLGQEATTFGFLFGRHTTASYMALADLMYGDPRAILRFIERRRKHKNLFVGATQFVRWGVVEPLRAIAYTLPRKLDAPQLHIAVKEVVDGLVPAPTPAVSVLVAEAITAPFESATPPLPSLTLVVEAAADPESSAAPEILPDFDALVASLPQPEPILSFDDLAEALVAFDPIDEVVDSVADWSQAVLTLAVEEMKRSEMPINVAA